MILSSIFGIYCDKYWTQISVVDGIIVSTNKTFIHIMIKKKHTKTNYLQTHKPKLKIAAQTPQYVSVSTNREGDRSQ